MEKSLSTSIGVYRGDGFQFDGKSDGKKFGPTPRKIFTVRHKWTLTVKILYKKSIKTTA
jgi:hypothetical protein